MVTLVDIKEAIKPQNGPHQRTYVIEGDPVPLARARFGNGRCWDSQKQTKLAWQLMLSNQHRGPLFSGPIDFTVIFFMPCPAKLAKRKHAELLNTYHHARPDTSNLVKFVEDVATKILYHDDAIIASLHAIKIYSDNPRVQLTITTLR